MMKIKYCTAKIFIFPAVPSLADILLLNVYSLGTAGTSYSNWLDAQRWIEHRALHTSGWSPIKVFLSPSSSPCISVSQLDGGRPNVWPLSRGHCGHLSHVEVARHAERCMLQGVITSLQLPPSTFFAALRPTNQIFHVSWHAPSTHKYLFDFHKSHIIQAYTLPGKVAISLVDNYMPVLSVHLRMQMGWAP